MGNDMRGLDRTELQELLLKCWMSHDGAWFCHCLQEFGIEAANRLNKAALRSLSQAEIPRITKALGIEIGQAPTFESLKQTIDGAFSIVKGDFMGAEYSFPADNVMSWTTNRCFAYEGMKRMGVIDRYECGLLYRVGCWIEVLGVAYEIDPPISGCLINEQGFCAGSVRFKF